MKTWWLSFADPYRPRGSQFLGACIVDAESPRGAVARSRELGINPGGEVLIVPAPDGIVVEARWKDRLLSREDIAAHDASMGVPEAARDASRCAARQAARGDRVDRDARVRRLQRSGRPLP